MCVAVCDGGSFCIFKRAGLKEGVTDEGLRALASAGRGEKLTSLALWSECCCVPVCDLMACESGSRSGSGVPDVCCCL